MSKVFEIELGGKTRRLTYDWNRARPFFKKQGQKPFRFLFSTCAGWLLDDQGRTQFYKDGRPVKNADLVDDDARLALLALGLGEDLDVVGDWISKAVQAGESLGDITWVAVKAALYAGVTGMSIDIDAMTDKGDADTEGKAEAPPEVAPPTP